MTTQTAAQMIDTQDKLTSLSKKSRELAEKIKYDNTFLAELKNGKSKGGVTFDVEFISYNMPRMQKELVEHTAKKDFIDGQIMALESLRTPAAALPYCQLLTFFKGTGYDAARNGLELLALCLKNGNWVPGASRRIRSVLNSAKAASKMRAAYLTASANLEAIFTKWDATRPAPTFTTEGASPTVTATLKDLDAVRVAVCEMEFKEVEYLDKNGQKAFMTIAKLLWPVGIKHGTSRYSETCNNSQCQACGHAIKNAFNWIPLVLTCSNGDTKSLWVGRDCAKTLFGIDMVGELEIEGGKQ